MNPILFAIILVTAIGLIGAVILVAASIFMYVPVDERVEKITAVLAGANCGACGCAGCADYAKSIVEDGNAVNKCTPGGAACAAKVAEIMGVDAGSTTPMKAVVACSGTCGKTGKKYEFQGIQSCQAVKGLYGGDGLCRFGCLGYGDCTRACAFDAIHIVDGIARVDRDKCTGCGACAAVCPNAVISIVPEHKRKPVVLCQNKDKGADTRKACTAGCIGCMKCAKACPKEAITVENFLARIDQVSTRELSIPVGSLSGSVLLAGRGPRISVRMESVGSSSANFENAFTSAGINQTKHQIVLNIDVAVSILLPGFSTATTVSNAVTVAETVIVGSVPDTYTYFSSTPESYESDAKDYILN